MKFIWEFVSDSGDSKVEFRGMGPLECPYEFDEDLINQELANPEDDLSQYIESPEVELILPIYVDSTFRLHWRVEGSVNPDRAESLQEEIIQFISGQSSDGWGEGFSQKSFKLGTFVDNHGFSVDTMYGYYIPNDRIVYAGDWIDE